MDKLSYKEREKRRREHEILLEARRLIQASGYADLNMDSLAEAVGISKPTLYQHFKSKEDLIVCALLNCIQEIADQLDFADEDSPLERLKTALRMVLVQRYVVDGLLADVGVESIFSSLHTHPEVAAAKKRVLAQIGEVVEAGKACGEIRPTIQTPVVGCLLLKMFGLPSTIRAAMTAQQDCPMSPEAMAAVIEQVIDLFARAVAQD